MKAIGGRKMRKALDAIERAQRELMTASSALVGLGKDCWMQKDAMDLANKVEQFGSDVQLWLDEVNS